MRIAVTGTHGTGKTTLTEDLAAACPDLKLVPEPLWVFADGMAFVDGPNIPHFEEQLAQSCALIVDQASRSNVVFDRCPFDYLAYLDMLSAEEGAEWSPQGRLLSRIEGAMGALDLLIFVPLAEPDEIEGGIEYPELRGRVDERLKMMLGEGNPDLLDAGPRVIEVFGAPDRRVADVRAEIGASSSI